MRAERSDPIRLAACTALRNSLLFCRGNMENKPERDMIMQVICEATQCKDGIVRAVAYECIVQIGEHYYDKLDDYMQVLAQLTFNSIKTEEEQVRGRRGRSPRSKSGAFSLLEYDISLSPLRSS